MLVGLVIVSCGGGASVAEATATPTPLNTTAAPTPPTAPTASPSLTPVPEPRTPEEVVTRANAYSSAAKSVLRTERQHGVRENGQPIDQTDERVLPSAGQLLFGERPDATLSATPCGTRQCWQVTATFAGTGGSRQMITAVVERGTYAWTSQVWVITYSNGNVLTFARTFKDWKPQ